MRGGIIKQANITDLKEIQELNLLLFEEEYEWDKSLNLGWTFSREGTDYFKRAIKDNDCCAYVYYEHTAIGTYVVGYLVGNITQCEGYKKSVRMSEVADMFVLFACRNQGIGKSLYNAFVDWSLNMDVNSVRVQTTFQNKKAIEFYKKMGLFEGTTILEGGIK